MKLKVLASGSSGNCTYLELGASKIMIDVGISFLQIKNILSTINVDINEIDYLLITHMHTDHTKGLASIINKTNIKLLIPSSLYDDISKVVKTDNIIFLDDITTIDDFQINLIHTSHDVISYGFLIRFESKELVYITDTGYINRKYIDMLKNKNIYIIESNHDEEMLMNGPYPYILKQRVIGDKGHLSNRYTGKFLSNCIGNNTEYIILAHISQHNNSKELALKQVMDELNDIDFNSKNILLADQYISLDLIEV